MIRDDSLSKMQTSVHLSLRPKHNQLRKKCLEDAMEGNEKVKCQRAKRAEEKTPSRAALIFFHFSAGTVLRACPCMLKYFITFSYK